MNLDDFLSIIMGFFMSLLGWHLIGSPMHTSWRFGTVDFGDFHGIVGALFLGVGLVAVIHPLRKLYRDQWKR